MGLWEDLATKVKKGEIGQQKAPFIEEGVYLLEVNRVISAQARSGLTYFVAEFLIIESSNPELPAGGACKFYVNSKDPDMMGKRIGEFIVNAFGFSAAEAAEILPHITGEGQPLSGLRLRCIAEPKVSSKDRPYLDLRWVPVAKAN